MVTPLRLNDHDSLPLFDLAYGKVQKMNCFVSPSVHSLRTCEWAEHLSNERLDS